MTNATTHADQTHATCDIDLAESSSPQTRARAAHTHTQGQVLRLICASEATTNDSPYAALEEIRTQSLPMNTTLKVHSALIYLSGWYLHWLEGREEDVMAVVARCSKDKRHARLRVLHYSLGPRTLPDLWSMGMIQPSERRSDIALRVNHLRALLMRGTQYSPLSVWRRVSMPVQSAHPTAGVSESPSCRIMLSCALPHQASAFLAWLAERNRTSVVEHRYAGHNTPDMGLSYVDTQCEGQGYRVVTASRQCLALGLSRVMHRDVSHWICMLSDDNARDAHLIERMAETIGDMGPKPRVLGIASSHAAHAHAAERLCERGFVYRAATLKPTSAHCRMLELIKSCLADWRDPRESEWPLPSQ